mgnify:CR=1 FL=1
MRRLAPAPSCSLIRGVRAAGSWKKYCRRQGPHREILALRGLAMRGYITPYPRRRTRGAEYKIAIAFVARLGDNGIVWNILSFWRDADDIEDITPVSYTHLTLPTILLV